MKSVLISIKPKWCELIASGKKTIEVRKTKPKLETHFKVYIYCTQDKNFNFCTDNGEQYTHIGNGKVIGEFICDRLYEIGYNYFYPVGYDVSMGELPREELYKKSCLSFNQMNNYLNMELGYGWHISNLVIYDKPKELSELKKHNRTCYYEHLGLATPKCKDCKDCQVTRPPQSWCYVEGVSESEM